MCSASCKSNKNVFCNRIWRRCIVVILFWFLYKLVSECGGTFTNHSGVIESPNFPKNYPVNFDCEWIITVPHTHALTLTFEEFNIEQGSKCKYDYVEVRDGAKKDARLVGEWNKLQPFSY